MTAIAAPLLVDTYWLNEVSRFLIFALAGLGLMIVTGYTGQVSLGHAAFLAVGAYAHTYFISHEMPFVISLILLIYSALCATLIAPRASKILKTWLAFKH